MARSCDEVRTPTTKFERLERDAERYRWAREQSPDTLFDLYMDLPGNAMPKDWDEAIDKSMASTSTRGAPVEGS